MSGEIWGFVAVETPSGGRALLNLDMTLAIIETATGATEAISIAGVKTQLGTKFDAFAQDVMRPLE
jgi:hypothetical protein